MRLGRENCALVRKVHLTTRVYGIVITIMYFIHSEEVTRVLQGTPDGSFLVCDSTRTHGEYTLTIRKGGANKHICIINKNEKFGFLNSEIISFSSVSELIEYYTVTPLTKYNPRLDITLSNPVSRFEVEVSHAFC